MAPFPRLNPCLLHGISVGACHWVGDCALYAGSLYTQCLAHSGVIKRIAIARQLRAHLSVCAQALFCKDMYVLAAEGT